MEMRAFSTQCNIPLAHSRLSFSTPEEQEEAFPITNTSKRGEKKALRIVEGEMLDKNPLRTL